MGTISYYSGTGTFSLPIDTNATGGGAQGGGGGGGGTWWSFRAPPGYLASSGGGGGGGGMAQGWFPVQAPNYSVGAGGAAGDAAGGAGGAGGDSTMWWFTGSGGAGGSPGTAAPPGGGGAGGAGGGSSYGSGGSYGLFSYEKGSGVTGGSGAFDWAYYGNGPPAGGTGGNPAGGEHGNGGNGGQGIYSAYQPGGVGQAGVCFLYYGQRGASISKCYNMSNVEDNRAYQGTSKEFYVTGSGFASVTDVYVNYKLTPGWSVYSTDSTLYFWSTTVAQQASFATTIRIYQPFCDTVHTDLSYTEYSFALDPNPPAFTSADYITFWDTGGTLTVRGSYFDICSATVNGSAAVVSGRGGLGEWIQITIPPISQQVTTVDIPVVIYNTSGSITVKIKYYPNQPTITSLSRSVIDQCGGPENNITVTGTYLSTINGVYFGSQPGTVSNPQSTSVDIIPPAVISSNESNNTLIIYTTGLPGSNAASSTFSWKNDDGMVAGFLAYTF